MMKALSFDKFVIKVGILFEVINFPFHIVQGLLNN
jgi:hypothetical protein